MKKKIRSILMFMVCLSVANNLFAQEASSSAAQHPNHGGTFIGRAMRSCFKGNTAKADVYVVINKADWCLVCKQNSDKLAAILTEFKSKPIAFISNDISDDKTSTVSSKYLKKLHVDRAVLPVKQTGVMIFIDAKTHQVMGQVSLAESKEKIEAALNSSVSDQGKI